MINIHDDQITHPETFEQLSVRDLLFVHYRCPQIERLIQLYNHYNMIAFSLDGERILHQGGDAWKITAQTSYFQRKTAYVQEISDAQNWEVIVFHLPDEFLAQFAEEFMDSFSAVRLPKPTSDMVIKVEVNEVTRTYFYSMLSYFRETNPPSEQLLELKFKELLLTILSNPQNEQLLAYVLSLKSRAKTPIWQVMEKNYTYNLTLLEYARISNRSLTAFKRDFADFYGTTPGKWLTERRLEHARDLLTRTEQSVSEVAFDSGFENVSHFSRIFKTKFGLSPLQFRKKQLTSA